MKIGVYTKTPNEEFIFMCECGKNKIEQNKGYVCECGNNSFKYLSSKYNGGKVVSPSFYRMIWETPYGFEIGLCKRVASYKRSNMSLTNIGEEITSFIIDFKNKIFTCNNNPITIDNCRDFFRGIEESELLQLFQQKNNISMFKFYSEYLETKNNSSWYKCTIRVYDEKVLYKRGRMSFAIMYIFANREDLQILNNANINDKIKFALLDSTNETIKMTKADKICSINKTILKRINKYDNILTSDIKMFLIHIRMLQNYVDNNKILEILDIMEEELGKERLYKLISDNRFFNVFPKILEYGLDSVKITKYLCREIKIEQGITSPVDGAVYLRDYIRMCKDMKINYEKFPRSLKKVHDITSMNYKIASDSIKERKFTEAVHVKEYEELLYSDKKYSIITPKSIKEVVSEGKELSHCVASYVDDIIRGNCQILFMRKTDTLEESLITLEVKNKRLKQAKGIRNRKCSEEEKEFIQKWCIKMGVEYYDNI